MAQITRGQALLFQAKYDLALGFLQSLSEETYPPLWFYQTALALFNLGRKEEAIVKIEDFLRKYPEDPGGTAASVRAMLFAAAGEEAKAEASIRSAVERGKGFIHFHHTAYNIGCAYALMNKPDSAMTWLQRTIEEGLPCYPLFERDPNLQSLRNDSRFIVMMERLKKQWEHYKSTIGPAMR